MQARVLRCDVREGRTWRVADQQRVRQASQGPHVRLTPVPRRRSGRQRLRRQVVGRAAQAAARRHARAAARGQAQVCEAHTAGVPLRQRRRRLLAAQQAVRGLDVAVRHAPRVQVRQRVQQRGGVRRRLVLRQLAPRRHRVRQRRAAAPLLQQQVHVGLVLERAVEAHQPPAGAQPPQEKRQVGGGTARDATRGDTATLPRSSTRAAACAPQGRHRQAACVPPARRAPHLWRKGACRSISCTSLRRALGDSFSVALLTTLSAKRCAVRVCSTIHTAAKPPLPSHATRANCSPPLGSVTSAGQSTPAERPAARSGLRAEAQAASASRPAAARRSQGGVRAAGGRQAADATERRTRERTVETSSARAQYRGPGGTAERVPYARQRPRQPGKPPEHASGAQGRATR